MKLLIGLLSAFFLSSCAHHHKEIDHHHHKNCDLQNEKGEMFEKYCAQSVSEGDLHVKGNEDFKLEHGGETYFFSTEEKLNTFKANLELNSKRARNNWNRDSRR